mgnify:CR=1 FL=1
MLQRVCGRNLVSVFGEQAQLARAEVIDTTKAEVMSHIARWLQEQNIEATLNIAPALQQWDWQSFVVHSGPADENSVVSITPALCGIAETGTVLCVSGPDTPTTLNFLPEVHIVLLDKRQIVATYEQAWQRIPFPMPRTANFITGPSRTGDIEQTLQFGAHGPKKLVIFLYRA